MIVLLFIALFAVGCNNDEDGLSAEETSRTIENTDGMMVLGKQLENPYSIENMTLAMQELYSTRSAVELKPTHLYVRFLPTTEEEMYVLRSDSTLDLYTYPLDYEVEKPGDYYHDPTLPKDAITWQYVVVKPDYEFPNIKYEILSELFILDEDKDNEVVTRSTKLAFIDWDVLEDRLVLNKFYKA